MLVLDEIKTIKLTSDHWKEFRAIRIYSLKTEQHLLYGDYEEYSQRPREYWVSLLSDVSTQIFGLVLNDKLVATSAVFPYWEDDTGDIGYLGWNYVLPKFRKKGYGKLLNILRMKWAKYDHGYKKLVVCCRQTNRASQKIYKKTGFEHTRSIMTEWPDGTIDEEYYFSLDLENYDLEK